MTETTGATRVSDGAPTSQPSAPSTYATPTITPGQPTQAATPGPSLAELVQTATRDLSLLVHKEVELAKLEVTAAAKGAAKGAAGLAAGAVFGLAAGIMLMFTLAEALNEFFPRPLAFLLTAVLFLVLAGIAALVGLKRMKTIKKPERTLVTVKDDIAWAKHPTMAPTVRTSAR